MSRLKKKEIQEIQNWMKENFAKYKKQIDEKAAQKFGVSLKQIGLYRLRAGLYLPNVYSVAEYVRKNPNKTIKEYATELGITIPTVCKANRMFNLGLNTKKWRNVVQEDIENKSFREAREELGMSETAFSHMVKRKGLVFKNDKPYEQRKNLQKIRKADLNELIEILAAREWCDMEQCNHNCQECCAKWLNVKAAQKTNDA